jgi:N-acetylglucosaminyldiphosphoundecaprenol N-acetyl-beta-D-mannosaminyltransferase
MQGDAGSLTSFMCCRVRIDALALDEAVERVVRMAQRHHGGAVHLCNAYTLSLAWRDTALASVLNAGELNLADGAPLFEVARRLRHPRPARRQRPRGADLLVATVGAGRPDGLRHYLYGASPETVSALARRLVELRPGAVVVGVESPPYRPLSPSEEEGAVARIAAARPDVVWVGLGTPRQDQTVHRFGGRLDAPVVAVGAAFDFVAGTRRQAPVWMRQVGLEWLYRLAREPRRLARRYLVGNLVFLAGLVREGVVVMADPTRPRPVSR